MIKQFYILLVFLLFYGHSNAQLVNIESKRMPLDSNRFALKSDLFFKYANNNGDYLFQIGSSLTTQLKSKDLKKIYFFIGNYNLIRSKDKDFENSWFFHLRYNQKLSNLFRLEAFIQNQNNELLTINSRNLIGAGIRLKIISKKPIKAYLGNAYMYEIENVKSTDQKYYNNRNSSYLSLTFSFPKSKLDLTSTTYFQPLYSNLNNHRILQQFRSEIPISKSISFSTLFDYFYNSFSSDEDKDFSSNLYFGQTFNM